MHKSLKEFTKQDWDTLFPIKLVKHNPAWAAIFEAEKEKILQAVDDRFFNRIEHFGSSSIPNIQSKPYIDILIEVPTAFLFNEQFIQELESIGYTCLTAPMPEQKEHYMIFAKGYHTDGTMEQVFHIHACPQGHPMLQQIKFRDYLRATPKRAQEYEALKIQLAASFTNDRSGYRIAKTAFIKATLDLVNNH